MTVFEQRDLVVLVAQRVVVVALMEGHVAFACGVIETRARGEAPLDRGTRRRYK